MTIVSEIYDDYILVYDYDENPIRPYKMVMDCDREGIDFCKKHLSGEREWEKQYPNGWPA